MNSAPVLRMEDLLGSLGGEQEHKKRELEVARSPALVDMCKKFEALFPRQIAYATKLYEVSEDNLPAKYTAEDVKQFSIVLVMYQSVKDFSAFAGHYVSALVNHCPDKEVTLITKHLGTQVRSLGFKIMDHALVIHGSTGDFLGSTMSGGKIVVHGDAGKAVGADMRGGVIRIEGEYESLSGCIRGGSIYHQGIQIVKDGKKV